MHIKTSTFIAAGILAIAGTPLCLHLMGGSGSHGTTANWIKTLHGGFAAGGHGTAGPTTNARSVDDLTGKWTVTIGTDQDKVECLMVLKQNGRKLEGTLSNPHGDGDFLIAGEYVDGAVTLAVDAKHDQSEMHLTFKGAIKKDDGSLAGTMTSAMGESKWTATRTKN